MRRFLISSAKFEGHAELVYGSTCRLIRIDLSSAVMDDDTIRHFKAAVPVLLADLESGKGFSATTTIVEADFEIALEDFKREYPYARNFHLLPPIWNKMTTAEQVEAYQAAMKYRKYCNRNSNWYKAKIAASWLKSREYKNDWDKM